MQSVLLNEKQATKRLYNIKKAIFIYYLLPLRETYKLRADKYLHFIEIRVGRPKYSRIRCDVLLASDGTVILGL
jgi:hypothetical protein